MSELQGTAVQVCPVCDNTHFEVMYEVADANFSKSISSFQVMRCTQCELAHMEPWPTVEELENLYRSEHVFSVNRTYKLSGKKPTSIAERLYRRFGSDDQFIARSCLELAQSAKQQSILDIGCSNGRLLNTFKTVGGDGLDLHGIDIDPGTLEVVPPWLRDNVRIGDFLNMGFDQKFNIITLKFVVEHLPNARDYIAKASQLLHEDGILFISTPDIDSAKARELGPQWPSLNDPDTKTGHIMWFNRMSLKALGQSAQLSLVKCTNRGELFYHLGATARGILTSIFGRDAHNRPIRNATLRLIYASFFDGAISETLNYGDSLYAFFKHTPHRL